MICIFIAILCMKIKKKKIQKEDTTVLRYQQMLLCSSVSVYVSLPLQKLMIQQALKRNLEPTQMPPSTTESSVQRVGGARVPPFRKQMRYRPARLPGRKVSTLGSYRSRSKKYGTQ